MLKEIISKNKNELNEIMKALSKCDFEELDYDIFESTFAYDFMHHYGKTIRFASGASKGVLIFQDLNFVIKIPFSYCDGCELCGADESNFGWDYCDQEVTRYELAKDDGFQDVFLEVEFFDYVNGYPIYIQPYAVILDSLTDIEYKALHNSSEKRDELFIRNVDNAENYSYLNSKWEADLYRIYGIGFYRKFKMFLQNNYIDDLNSDNIGYIGKRPVLVDYAGFNS